MPRNIFRTALHHWPIASAVLFGLALSILFGGAFVLVRENVGVASARDDASRAVGERLLRIGLDYVPPERAPDMRIYVEEGFEADLAQEIGERLRTRVELVQTSSGEQERALRDGRIDLVLTRRAPTERVGHAIARLATPFASGQSLAMRSDRPLGNWQALAGKTVCATEANERGQRIARGFGADVTTVRAPAQALMLVRTGECYAAIHDRASLDHLFGKMSWQKFSATLPPIEPTQLVALAASDRATLIDEVEWALTALASAEQWEQRTRRWAQLVAFEVYRDQVAADCH